MLAERFVLRTDREGRLAGLLVFPPTQVPTWEHSF